MAFRPELTPTDARGASPIAGLGCAPIGNLFAPVADDAAHDTVHRAFDRGVRFFDTAPHYGAGVSEDRLGRALRGVARNRYVIATKTGRRIVDADGRTVRPGATGVETVGDLSRDGLLRSVEGSLIRLGTDHIDLLHLHDPADMAAALDVAMPTLTQLRDEGVVRAVGVGMVHVAPLLRFIRESEPDVVMPALRLTLLDRSAEDALLPEAAARGIGVLAAGVFNSGILADPERAAFFDYQPAAEAQVELARAMAGVCAKFGIRLSHAAAAYPLRFDGVEGVVVGARTPQEVDSFCDGLAVSIPEGVWAELDRLHGQSPLPQV